MERGGPPPPQNRDRKESALFFQPSTLAHGILDYSFADEAHAYGDSTEGLVVVLAEAGLFGGDLSFLFYR